MAFYQSRIKKMKISVFVLSLAFLTGCDVIFKKPEQSNKGHLPKSITLPSGEKVSLQESASGFKENPNNWQDGAKLRAEQCVSSICQIEESFVYKLEGFTYFLTTDERSRLPEGERIFDTEIWPKLKNVIGIERASFEDSQRKIVNLLSRIPKDKAIQVDPVTKAFIKFALVKSRLEAYKWDNHYDQEHYIKTKKFALKESVMNELSESERKSIEHALHFFNRYMYDYILNSNLAIIEKLGLRTYILFNYGRSNFEESKQKFLTDIKIKSDTVKARSPLFYEVISKNVSLQRVLNGQELMPIEEIDLKSALESLQLFNDLIEKPWPELDGVVVDFDALLSGQEVAKRIHQYIESNSGEKEQEKHDASLNKAYGICKQSLSAHIVSRPTQTQIKNFENLISKVKEASKGVAAKLFNTASVAQIHAIADGIQFTIPSSQDDALQKILNDVQALSKILSINVLKDLDDLSDKETENLLGLILAAAESDKNEMDEKYSDISGFCQKYIPADLTDFAVSVENRVSISAKVVNAGVKGIGVLAHEVGHRFEFDLGRTPKTDLLTCLKDRHFSAFSKTDTSINRELYLVEDFADQFSSMVLKKLGYTAAENNLACLFFRKAKWDEDGSNVPLFSSDISHPMISTYDDNHSAHTFRLLQIAHNLGHNTQVCQDFVKAESGKTYQDGVGGLLITPIVRKCEAN